MILRLALIAQFAHGGVPFPRESFGMTTLR
jgi:hypothetical protein